VKNWDVSAELYATGVQRLTDAEVGKCVDSEGDFVENNLSFVTDVALVCVNSILLVITISEKKVGIAFVPTFVFHLKHLGKIVPSTCKAIYEVLRIG
jgi:hypothetical protein